MPVPWKVVGISRLNLSSTKTPRKIKLSKTETRHRSENPVPEPRPEKKSTGGAGYYWRNRKVPSAEERSNCQKKMAEIVGRHQTTGNIWGRPRTAWDCRAFNDWNSSCRQSNGSREVSPGLEGDPLFGGLA